MCPNEAYNTLLFMQIAILLHDLQLHLIIINVYTGTILKPYITYTKQKHLGCKKGEANQKQQLSDYKSIHSYTCDFSISLLFVKIKLYRTCIAV